MIEGFFMKKIAIVISDITKRAGTERAVTNLANLLADSQQYDVSIISIEKQNSSVAYSLSKNVQIIYFQLQYLNSKLSRILRHIKTFQKLKQVINDANFDALIGTEYYINYLLTLLPKKRITIGCEHTNYDKPPFYHKILRKIFYPKMSAIVTLTQNDLQRYTFVKNKFCIPNSLSFTPFEFAKYNNKTFVTCGRLNYQKGIDLLLQSAKIIKSKLPDWKIKIYGEGEEHSRLLTIIKENNLKDYVEILKPTQDIQSVYANSSVYLLPSRFEGLPMVLLESQATGLPAVCFNCKEGPADVIVDGVNGSLIPTFDIQLFAQKAVNIAENEELYNNMSLKAIELSSRFSPEKIFSLWNSVFSILFNYKG